MNNKKHKSSGFVLIIAVFFIVLTMTFLMILAFKSGYLGNNTKGVHYYDSIQDMLNSSNMDIELPNFIYDEQDLEIRNTLGEVVEIGNDNIVLKIANFVDYEADILGLYEESETDYKYNVESDNNNINYFRYRLGYKDYPNCTLINWCSDNTAYGLMLGDIYSEEEALSLLEINKSELSTYSKNKDTISSESNFKNYTIKNFTVNMPNFKSNITVNDYNGYTAFSIDEHAVLVFVYNNFDEAKEIFGSQSKIDINEDLIIYYLTDNPFSYNSNAYIDYNNFINTINDIIASIEYLE